jgi:hypothetical protein
LAHSIIRVPGTGSNGPFAVNFTLGFLSRTHVTAYVEGESDTLGNQAYRVITWINDSLITVGGSPIVSPQFLIISRDTPVNAPVHDYQNGSVLEEANLDQSYLQTILVAQEMHDGKNSNVLLHELDAAGFRIRHLADGVETTDAATVGQVAAAKEINTAAITQIQAAASTALDSIYKMADSAVEGINSISNTASASAGLAIDAADRAEVAANAVNQDAIEVGYLAASVSSVAVSVESRTASAENSAALATAQADRAYTAVNSAVASVVAQTNEAAELATNQAVIATTKATESALSASGASAAKTAAEVAASSAAVSLAHVSDATVFVAAAVLDTIGYVADAAYEVARASAYANATGTSTAVTGTLSQILAPTMDLGAIPLVASVFNNENFPAMRIDLAAESGITDFGGLA